MNLGSRPTCRRGAGEVSTGPGERPRRAWDTGPRLAPAGHGNPYTPGPAREPVYDLEETPAVPPFDPGGDVRLGYFAAGGTLVALGWGLGVTVNLLLHLLAPAGGHRLWHVFVGPSLGPYAWATLGLGVFSGAFGVVLLILGRNSARGPFVLPGVDA
jgi:hypothetical protein